MSDDVKTLFRAAAVAVIVSAVLTVPGFAVHPAVEPEAMTRTAWVVSHLLLWVGAVAGTAGVVGLYLRQHEGVGRVGAVGAGLACVGLLALSGAYYYEAIIVPTLATEVPALMDTFPGGESWAVYRAAVAGSGALLALGFLLFGIAMLRTPLLSRWAIVVASLGAIGAGVQFLLPRPVAFGVFLMLGLGLVGLGYSLWTSISTLGPHSAS